MDVLSKQDGVFEVFESYAIKSKDQYLFKGKLVHGLLEEQCYLNVPIEKEVFITIKVDCIDEITLPEKDQNMLLLTVYCDPKTIDLFLALEITHELLPITLELVS